MMGDLYVLNRWFLGQKNRLIFFSSILFFIENSFDFNEFGCEQ